MKIGIDFRALQIGHQYRGIGEVTRQVTKELVKLAGSKDSFVFFVYDGMPLPDMDFLGIEKPRFSHLPKPAEGRKARLKNFISMRGDVIQPLIAKRCDVFLQFDFELGLPERHANVLMVHDQIPYILGNIYPNTYLPDYHTARRMGLTRKDALKRSMFHRHVYLRNMRVMLDRATEILTVSDHTARTTVDFASASRRPHLSITTALLGYSHPKRSSDKLRKIEQCRFDELGLKHGNFLFFVGGIDDRRRIDQLVAAFNNLRAEGHKIKLVLAGHDFRSIDSIFSPATRRALEDSSYQKDIHMLGFVSDAERTWLYKNGLAFVFPTEYEGFGLPVLEAQAAGCTVITYNNSSLPEVAGQNTILVDDWRGIVEAVKRLKKLPAKEHAEMIAGGQEWVKNFTWHHTGQITYEALARAYSQKPRK